MSVWNRLFCQSIAVSSFVKHFRIKIAGHQFVAKDSRGCGLDAERQQTWLSAVPLTDKSCSMISSTLSLVSTLGCFDRSPSGAFLRAPDDWTDDIITQLITKEYLTTSLASATVVGLCHVLNRYSIYWVLYRVLCVNVRHDTAILHALKYTYWQTASI